MCHLFGRAVEVSATIDTLKDAIESEDTSAATVRFESGALACCYATMTALRTTQAFDNRSRRSCLPMRLTTGS